MDSNKIITLQQIKIFTHIDLQELYDEKKLIRNDHIWIRHLFDDIFKNIIYNIDENSRLKIDIDTTSIPFSKYELLVISDNFEKTPDIYNSINDNISKVLDFILYIKQNFALKNDLNFKEIYNSFNEKNLLSQIKTEENNELILKRI